MSTRLILIFTKTMIVHKHPFLFRGVLPGLRETLSHHHATAINVKDDQWLLSSLDQLIFTSIQKISVHGVLRCAFNVNWYIFRWEMLKSEGASCLLKFVSNRSKATMHITKELGTLLSYNVLSLCSLEKLAGETVLIFVSE